MSAIPHYPQRHPISAQEYLRMAEAGVFAADARLELMEGEIIEMAPIGSRHAAVVNTLNALLNQVAGDAAIVSVQNPVIAGERSVPQPDLLLLKARADRYFDAHPVAADVLLVVEVSDTTLRFDLESKIPVYARAAIAEAWVVDIERRVIHVHGDLESGVYRTNSIAAIGARIAIPGIPTATLSIASLFPA